MEEQASLPVARVARVGLMELLQAVRVEQLMQAGHQTVLLVQIMLVMVVEVEVEVEEKMEALVAALVLVMSVLVVEVVVEALPLQQLMAQESRRETHLILPMSRQQGKVAAFQLPVLQERSYIAIQSHRQSYCL